MNLNLQRVLDPDLPVDQREASFDLISSLVGPGGKLPSEISLVLSQRNCPPSLRSRITGKPVSIAKVPDNGQRTGPVTPVPVPNGVRRLSLGELQNAPAGPRRTATLRWLVNNPKPQALVALVKLWALQPVGGQDENLFRQAVGKIGSGRWHEVLLGSLNTKKFGARGSAMEVLVARGGEIDLLRRIKSITPKTDSVRAMKIFAVKFGYVPANGNELLASVVIYKSVKKSLDPPARLARQWSAMYKYKFNIRDFHLLNNLSADTLRNKIGRGELVRQIQAKLGRRKHVARGVGTFSKQSARMTMPDLWNIVLLDEMLSRQRVSLALRILADRLRTGLSSPRSGLVFYTGGKAAAKLYPQSVDSARGDRDHIPERELLQTGYNAMCHLHTRFEKVYNGDRAPASRREISSASQGNYCGLVLVSVDSGTFSAFYYNPNGKAVSMGLFAFGK